MFARIVLAALIFAAATAPALAGPANGVTGNLPEPASMTLFGLGIGGAYVAKRFFNRK
jgi:hypothetical protein